MEVGKVTVSVVIPAVIEVSVYVIIYEVTDVFLIHVNFLSYNVVYNFSKGSYVNRLLRETPTSWFYEVELYSCLSVCCVLPELVFKVHKIFTFGEKCIRI